MTRDPDPEPNAIPVRAVLLMILISLGIVAVAAAVAWLVFPGAHREENPLPAPVAGIPLEIEPVAVYRNWRAEQQALLAGAGGRVPIEAAMAAVVATGSLDAEGRP